MYGTCDPDTAGPPVRNPIHFWWSMIHSENFIIKMNLTSDTDPNLVGRYMLNSVTKWMILSTGQAVENNSKCGFSTTIHSIIG